MNPEVKHIGDWIVSGRKLINNGSKTIEKKESWKGVSAEARWRPHLVTGRGGKDKTARDRRASQWWCETRSDLGHRPSYLS